MEQHWRASETLDVKDVWVLQVYHCKKCSGAPNVRPQLNFVKKMFSSDTGHLLLDLIDEVPIKLQNNAWVPTPAPAFGVPAESLEVYHVIIKNLEHALDTASWIALAQYLGVEASAIPSQAGGNTTQFWARLRAKEHFYADLQLGCDVSDDFRNAIVKLEFLGKQRLLRKLDEFRTQFCVMNAVVDPSRDRIVPVSTSSRMLNNK